MGYRSPHSSRRTRARWGLASKEMSKKARRWIDGFDSEQSRRILADERAVIFSVTVYHLGEVNLVQQSFFADVGIHMSWQEPQLQTRPREIAVTDLQLDDLMVHVPTIFIENSLEVKPVSKALLTMRSKDPAGVVPPHCDHHK